MEAAVVFDLVLDAGDELYWLEVRLAGAVCGVCLERPAADPGRTGRPREDRLALERVLDEEVEPEGVLVDGDVIGGALIGAL